MLCIQEELGHLSLQSTARLSPPPPHDPNLPCSDPGNNARALSPVPGGVGNNNSEDSSAASVEYKGTDAARLGFFDGLLGCLRPVWTIIGKATANELKGQGQCQGYNIYI